MLILLKKLNKIWFSFLQSTDSLYGKKMARARRMLDIVGAERFLYTSVPSHAASGIYAIGKNIAGKRLLTLILMIPSIFKPIARTKSPPAADIIAIVSAGRTLLKSPAESVIKP